MIRRLLAFGIGIGIGSLGLGVTACAPQQEAESPLRYSENAKRAYDEALEEYFDGDWEAATELFQEVRRKYGYSRWARLAELRIADAAYRQEKFAEAISGYRSFVHDYPNDAEVPYARYKITKAQFAQAGESILLPPLEERDLAVVVDAHQSLRSFLADHPSYRHAGELRYMLAVVTGVLARHELYVARFYLAEDNFDAAVARCQYALREYEDSGLEPEAMVLLGETYLKMKQTRKARAVFRHVLARWPDSAFVVPARTFLEQMGDRAPVPAGLPPLGAPARSGS
jgi:outer membrane protein assembly factor BamD